MPRPKGMDTESRAQILYLWAGFFAILAFGLLAFFSYVNAQIVNHDAKSDLPAGKSYHRICELTEAENIEIINRRLPKAEIKRYESEQAKLYTYFLQHGYATTGNNKRVHGGYTTKFPDPDRLYIVNRTGHTSVYPFWVVDGCVVKQFLQIPRGLHNVILIHMKAHPT